MTSPKRKAKTTMLARLDGNGGWRIGPLLLLFPAMAAWFEVLMWPLGTITAGSILHKGRQGVLLGRFADRNAPLYLRSSN